MFDRACLHKANMEALLAIRTGNLDQLVQVLTTNSFFRPVGLLPVSVDTHLAGSLDENCEQPLLTKAVILGRSGRSPLPRDPPFVLTFVDIPPGLPRPITSSAAAPRCRCECGLR